MTQAASGGCRTNVRAGGGDNRSIFIRKPMMMMIVHEDDHECNSSGSSSSIGDDSDADHREEVESSYSHDNQDCNGFDGAIKALEQSLPIRRGISTFYNGKSKSFTCLADVLPTSSIHDITKAENSYMRKRRNLGAFRLSYINKRRIQKKHKTTRLQFAFDPEDPELTKHTTRSQINRSLALRSFSMVDLHQTKIRNC